MTASASAYSPSIYITGALLRVQPKVVSLSVGVEELSRLITVENNMRRRYDLPLLDVPSASGDLPATQARRVLYLKHSPHTRHRYKCMSRDCELADLKGFTVRVKVSLSYYKFRATALPTDPPSTAPRVVEGVSRRAVEMSD